jgi:hypothetical protein
VEPKTEAVPRSQAPSIHPSTVPLLVLDPSVYQTRPPLSSGWKPFCHSHLSGNLTMNGLWYAYLKSRLSDPICRMGSCFICQEFLV